jgi:dihydrofolate synthase/folylpolyglutamate synthase
VRVAGVSAADAELIRAFERVERARKETPLTYFEFATLAGMAIFIDANVDVAILEVGLGGRLDAVNAFDAECAVIVSIALDHMDYLGTTREAIGFEKAGIFRRGKVAICADPDPPESMIQHASDIGTDFLRIGEDFGYTTGGEDWEFWGYHGKKSALPYPGLLGEHQLRNAAAALAALDELRAKLPVSLNDIRRGLSEIELPGRFQVIAGRPTVVLDVAHNPHAAAALAQTLAQTEQEFENTVAVFAILKDKDIAGVVQAIAPRIDEWLVASIDAARGASADLLAKVICAQLQDARVSQYEKPEHAYRHAIQKARQNDRICVFGSFYTVAAALTEYAVSSR